MNKKLILILVTFSLLVMFFNLGQRSLWEPDEGRYAQMSQGMLSSGDWLTPRQNYIKHFDKPPITYWSIATSFRLFGENEFAAHLPLVIFGLVGILATFLLGKTLFGVRSGFLAACILTSTLGYPAISRVVSTDIIFTVFCLLSYLFFARGNYLLFYASLALGFMTKGPVVFVITVLPLCIFLIYERAWKTFGKIPWIKGALLFTLIGLPWFIYQIISNPGLLNDWIFQQTLNRVVRKMKDPPYFFIPVLIGFFFPWIFFMIAALKNRLIFKRSPINQDSAKLLLLFIWFALPFIFFSCIGKKLVPYILPLLAPLAIIMGSFWDKLLEDKQLLETKSFSISYYSYISVLSIVFFGSLTFLYLGWADRLTLKVAGIFEAVYINATIIPIIMLLTIILSLIFFRAKKPMQLFATLAISSVCFFLNIADVLPKVEPHTNKSIKPLAMAIQQQLGPKDKVVNYRCFLKSLPFYLKRRTIVVERQRNIAYEETNDWRDYILGDKDDLYQLLDSKDFRVFCITYTWEWEKIRKEYKDELLFLGRTGKYVLFSN